VIDTNWDGVIVDMRKYGWELVTILQTHDTTVTQILPTKSSSLMCMFFPAANG
jgi:hypothetical protein